MVAILKIPFDKCIVDKTRRGAAEAPNIIQKFVENKEFVWKGVEISDDFEAMQNNITKAALEGYEEGMVIGVGGDHSISYGLMRAFAKKFKDRALIYFDAHLDCEDDFLPPTHEDIIRAAVNEGFFAPNDIMIVGARKFYPKEIEFIKNQGIRLGKLKDIEGFIKNKKNLYVSIDIDIFDPKYAPGTGYPEEGGLSPEKLLPIIKLLVRSGKVKGADIVEVNPKKDVDSKTSKLAAKLLIEFLQADFEKDI